MKKLFRGLFRACVPLDQRVVIDRPRSSVPLQRCPCSKPDKPVDGVRPEDLGEKTMKSRMGGKKGDEAAAQKTA